MEDRLDTAALRNDLDALAADLRRSLGPHDLAHLRSIERWGRLCTALGLATAWVAPNPLSIVLLSTGRFARWAMVGHHVGHRGYDRIEGGPKGKPFAEGWRRPLDWLDWLVPAAWKHEHNVLHHYRLNDERDPDLVEANLAWLRTSNWPMWRRLLLVAFFALTWKWTYYAPNTLAELRRAGEDEPTQRTSTSFDPRTAQGRELWRRALLPYGLATFVLLPLLFLPLGPFAVASVLVNSLLAELLTNLHAFVAIVPNHAGGDLYRFTGPPQGKGDFYLRQILGSANYRTGGRVRDFLQGYLNYQIEHHLFPDLPMSAYVRAQPRVKAICEAHGVPYVQEHVFVRVWRTVRVMVGVESMREWKGTTVEGADEAA